MIFKDIFFFDILDETKKKIKREKLLFIANIIIIILLIHFNLLFILKKISKKCWDTIFKYIYICKSFVNIENPFSPISIIKKIQDFFHKSKLLNIWALNGQSGHCTLFVNHNFSLKVMWHLFQYWSFWMISYNEFLSIW